MVWDGMAWQLDGVSTIGNLADADIFYLSCQVWYQHLGFNDHLILSFKDYYH